MSKFKIDDRVKIIQEGHPALGVIGTVTETNRQSSYNNRVEFDNYVEGLGDDDVFTDDDLELVTDNVNSPSHYIFPGGVEVIQITQHLNFCRGNAIKYLARAGKKDIADELEDLRKARFYVECEIARIEAQSS